MCWTAEFFTFLDNLMTLFQLQKLFSVDMEARTAYKTIQPRFLMTAEQTDYTGAVRAAQGSVRPSLTQDQLALTGRDFCWRVPPPPVTVLLRRVSAKEVDASLIDRSRRHSVAEIRTDLCRQLTVAERYSCFDLFAVYTFLRHKMPVCLYTEKVVLSNFHQAVLHHNEGTKGESKVIRKRSRKEGYPPLPLV